MLIFLHFSSSVAVQPQACLVGAQSSWILVDEQTTTDGYGDHQIRLPACWLQPITVQQKVWGSTTIILGPCPSNNTLQVNRLGLSWPKLYVDRCQSTSLSIGAILLSFCDATEIINRLELSIGMGILQTAKAYSTSLRWRGLSLTCLSDLADIWSNRGQPSMRLWDLAVLHVQHQTGASKVHVICQSDLSTRI